jgi:glycosyltransferase involved in cell wall biosynthesis
MPEPRSGSGFGFNLIGFASANLGLGVALRNTASILERNGFPFCVIDVDAGGGRSGHDHSLARHHHVGGVPPYPVNLFHLNPPELDLLLKAHAEVLPTRDRLNVCVPFWELPAMPASWLDVLERMDLVLAPSHFIQGTLSTQLHWTASRHYPQAIAEPPEAQPDRARWGIAPDRVAFLCSFDLASDYHRKNPLGVMAGFEKAFGTSGRAQLVLKFNNSRMNADTQRSAALIAAKAAALPGVLLVDQVLPYRDLMSLYASADVYVSLHRGEGLGLGLMENMLLGKPVIATDWSGNMDFTDDANACLVGHTLIPVAEESPYHAQCPGMAPVWADPFQDEAARWMVRLQADEGLRRDIGGWARESMRRWLEEARKGRVFESIRRFHENRSFRLPVVSASAPAAVPSSDATWAAVGPAESSFVHAPASAPAASSPSSAESRSKVVLQNREDNFQLPGGDTILLDALHRAFQEIGVGSRISTALAPDLDGEDVVQLTNITRSWDTLQQLRNAKRRGRPTVLVPLFEDLDRYLARSYKLSLVYFQLIDRGERFSPEEILAIADGCHLNTHPLDNPFSREKGIGNREMQAEILAGVDMILTSGTQETDLLRSHFRFEAGISELHYGVAPEFRHADPGPFVAKFGLKDFILFVGRIEERKNPWLLIEIMRSLPDKHLVMIGKFGHPQAEATIKAHAPKNVTFLNRLTREELISAFAASRLHVLPSWYELPGLVSLEAAASGSRVVTTSWGTARDYFKDMVRYCEPDRPASIRTAILEAFDSRPNPDLREYVLENYAWRRTALRLKEIYASLARPGAANIGPGRAGSRIKAV